MPLTDYRRERTGVCGHHFGIGWAGRGRESKSAAREKWPRDGRAAMKGRTAKVCWRTGETTSRC